VTLQNRIIFLRYFTTRTKPAGAQKCRLTSGSDPTPDFSPDFSQQTKKHKNTSQPNMADKPDFATARQTLLTELFHIFTTRWGSAVTAAASLENVSRQPDGNMVEFINDGKFSCCSPTVTVTEYLRVPYNI
jgi:hypothetical protein